MTPEQAVNILEQVTAQQLLVRSDQNAVLQAVSVLRQFIQQSPPRIDQDAIQQAMVALNKVAQQPEPPTEEEAKE